MYPCDGDNYGGGDDDDDDGNQGDYDDGNHGDAVPVRWTRCNKEKIHGTVEYWLPDLLQGCEYEFRVSAENVVGLGDPSPATKPVFAKDPIGR